MANVAFVASIFNEVDEIKNQLKKKGILDKIDVFPFGTKDDPLEDNYELSGYEVTLNNVRPNKTHGEILDLGQCVNNHGFPEDDYSPPEYTGSTLVDKRAMQEATGHLRLEHLQATIEGDTPEPVTRDDYNLKIEQIIRNAKKLTNLTTRELSNKLEISEKTTEIIAITAVLFDKIHSDNNQVDKQGRPARGYMSNKGKPVVNFLNENSITWIAEPWDVALEKEEPFYKRKYTKALRTRCKNLLLQKGTIYALRFFIDFLLKEDFVEKEITEVGQATKVETENGTIITYEGFEDGSIPF